MGQVRLQKVMAAAGVGSRRACEELIEAGAVTVNGQTVVRLPVLVDPASDRIEVEGRPLRLPRLRRRAESLGRLAEGKPGPIAPERLVYVMYYKPAGVVTSASDDLGRKTVADLVRHASGERLYPVGRLDYDSMGLLLMTNDGELANRLTHPRYGVHKTYRTIVKGELSDDAVEKLKKGIILALKGSKRSVAKREVRGQVLAKPSEIAAARRSRDAEPVEVVKVSGVAIRIVSRQSAGRGGRGEPDVRAKARTVLDITLAEGRNRQVRRMLAKVGCPVKKLVRIQMGPLRLKGLQVGQWRDLTPGELASLRKAARAGGEPAAAPRPRPDDEEREQ
ncbi:MAG: rRNA pseudouridine synthase [Phycisphaerales bacterium]|nr:rRNA pseudouridine synthase [Phycisphaerales bacterium]